MNQIKLLLIGAVATLPAFAGNIQVTTLGTASMPAEYIGVSVAVHSKCHRKSQEAAAQNAQLANSILTVMEKYVTEEARLKLKDPVTAEGGFFTRQSETIYKDGRNIVLCENRWRTSKQLTLKLLSVDKLAEVQDAVLALVDASAEARESGDPQTWADFNNPTPRLTPASEKVLYDRALRSAVSNARAELKSLVSECAIRGARLTDIRAPGQPYPQPQGAKAESFALSDSSGPNSPFKFGELTASVTRVFTFTYDESGSCRR